jgi:hypothetical protein
MKYVLVDVHNPCRVIGIFDTLEQGQQYRNDHKLIGWVCVSMENQQRTPRGWDKI